MTFGFVCPKCGSREFGSSNCTGPGPMVRHCHGYIPAPDGGMTSCRYSFPESEDEAHGLGRIEPEFVAYEGGKP